MCVGDELARVMEQQIAHLLLRPLQRVLRQVGVARRQVETKMLRRGTQRRFVGDDVIARSEVAWVVG